MHHRAWWRALRFVVGLGLAGAAFYALDGQRGELAGASVYLARIKVGWLLAAIASEIVSFVSFGMLQRRLLACAEVDVGLGYSTVLSLASGAIADSLPAGPAFSSVYVFRQYRRRGAGDAQAGWVLVATFVCAALSLALLATAGVLLATSESASYDLVGVTLGVLALTIVADAVVWQRSWSARALVWLVELSHRLVGLPRRSGVDVVEELLGRLTSVELSWRDLGVSIGAGLGNWAFDCASLVFGFLAVGAVVPWRGLLLAYGAGQLAANLPITPGGLGVVEGSMTIALVAFGGGEVSTVAAVLCYRIVSFWGYLPVGWAAWAARAAADRRADRAADRAAVGPMGAGKSAQQVQHDGAGAGASQDALERAATGVGAELVPVERATDDGLDTWGRIG